MSVPNKQVKKQEGKVSYVQKVIGTDTYLVMAHSQVELEDEFATLYFTVQNQSNIFLQPPFDPQVLLGFTQTNNILGQCVEAMEVNIDATGHEFIASDVAQGTVDKMRSDWKAAQAAKKQARSKAVVDRKNAVQAARLQAASGATDDSGQPMPIDWPMPLQYEQDDPTPEFGSGIDPEELAQAKAFFNEPYPGISFSRIRRKLRREAESVGYAYLEVLRNLQGDLVGLRNIETHNTRMVKLDAPILVEKTVMRNGEQVNLQIWERQRRFAQRVALKQLVYYREFGTARHIDRNTGKWEDENYVVLPENRGTELLVFGIHPDTESAYFVPRWINNLPSVIGSRKAEELNLEYLDAGGMPPAIIFVQGGTLAKDASDQLRMYLSGQNKNKHRAVVVEAMSSSGSLESAGSVQVKVERFGGEKIMDAMFTKYDAVTEEHVRTSFRIPPLFLGKPADYNLATAQTAYMVAEEQVFQPERNAFDELINSTIIKELGFTTLRIKSNPVTLSNAPDQISALTQAKGTVTNDTFVDAINMITGFDLEAQETPVAGATPDDSDNAFPPSPGGAGAAAGLPSAGGSSDAGKMLASNSPNPTVPSTGGSSSAAKTIGSNSPNPPVPNVGGSSDDSAILNSNKSETPLTPTELIDLAQDYLAMKGLVAKREIGSVRADYVTAAVRRLTKSERPVFDSLIAAYTYGSGEPDLVHLAHHACLH